MLGNPSFVRLRSLFFWGVLAAFLGTSSLTADATESTTAKSQSALADEARALRVRIQAPEAEQGEAKEVSSLPILNDAEKLLERIRQADPDAPRARIALHLYHSVVEIPDSDALAYEILTETIKLADALGDHAKLAYARWRLAGQYAEANRLEEAGQLATRSAFDAARAPHLETLYRAHVLLGQIKNRQQDRAGALAEYRKAVSVLETMRAETAARSTDERFSFAIEVEPVYLALVDLLLSDLKDSDSESAQQALLREVRETIELSRQAELRDHFEDPCLSSQSSVVADEIPGTVVVYPISLPDRVELIVSFNGNLSRHRAPANSEELDTLARNFRFALEDRMTRRYLRESQALYETLISPIASRLENSHIDALVFVPNRALRQIPLAALWNAEKKRFLIEEFPIAVTPSLRLTAPRAINPTTARTLFGGLTKAVRGFAPLPAVQQEREALEAQFDPESYIDETFQSGRYQSRLREAPFEIVHIASHGEFSADPKESFVLTWDGRITLDELSETIASTRFREKNALELLVLSACETAIGDDRSALGLAGAAVRMGARSVVATLWSVNDEASAELIGHFYEELARPGQSRAAALQAAQIRFLRAYPYAHPIDWAPFLLINSWL